MIHNRRTSNDLITYEQLEMIQQAVFNQYDADHNGFLE